MIRQNFFRDYNLGISSWGGSRLGRFLDEENEQIGWVGGKSVW